MSRPTLLGVSFLCLIVIAGGGVCDDKTHSESRTNILVFLVDALRADHLSCYGYTRQTGPYLDQFAKSAFLFERATSQSSWTYPSLASLFTGLYPCVHGVNKVHHRDQRITLDALNRHCLPLAEVLRVNGWDTAAFVANPWFTEETGLRRGFEHFDTRVQGLDADGGRLTARVLQWLKGYRARADSSKGLFLYLHYMDTHAPFVLPAGAPRPFEAPKPASLLPTEVWNGMKSYDDYWLIPFGDSRDIGFYVATYDNCILYADRNFQEVVEDLESHPEDGQWIIVFLSDHGESLMEGPGYAHDHGTRLYHRELWVPFLIKAAHLNIQPKRISPRVQLLDLPPTLCDLLRIEWPLPSQGKSLLPMMVKGVGEEMPVFAQSSKDEGDTSIMFEHWHFRDEPKRKGQRLYDISSDPIELKDISEDHPEVMKRSQEYLENYRRGCEALQAVFYNPREVSLDEAASEELRSLGYLR